MLNKQNQSGFSIVESLLAMALLAMVGLLLTYFSSNRLSQVANRERSSCVLHARTTLEKIQAIGGAKSLNEIRMGANRVVRPNLHSESVIGYIDIRDEAFVNGDVLFNKVGGDGLRTELLSHRAIVGSISMLNALYDDNPAYCSDEGYEYTGQGDLSLVETGDFELLRNINSTIRIRPYLLASGAELACPRPLTVIPRSRVGSTPEAYEADVVARLNPAQYRHDVGYKVTVLSRFENSTGQRDECEATATFAYPNMSATETTLGDLRVNVLTKADQTNLTGIASDTQFSSCATTIPLVQLKIQVDIPNYSSERGMTVLCRDQSFDYDPPAAQCTNLPTLDRNITREDVFTPCHLMRLCGQAPAENPIAARPTYSPNGEITVNYFNVNIACDIRVEVRVVDVALNIAQSATPNYPINISRGACNSCSSGIPIQLGGWCPGTPPGTVITEAQGCQGGPGPGGPTLPNGGDGGTDGAADGGHSDGKGGDGGDE